MGFSPTDCILLGLAALIVVVFSAAFSTRRGILDIADRLAARPLVTMLMLALLPIGLRLALLGHHPVPIPRVADDFSYLLLGDTLAHFRLANPMHPMRRFFEAVFVLQEPSYASIFPLGQGIALAFGQLVFHQPWAGVLLSDGLLAALCYWMLRAWVDARWALLGGILAAIEFGPLSSWMNTYWGGAVSGIAGCLVFGALPRLKSQPLIPVALVLGLGLGLQLLTRPFEFVIVLLAVVLYVIPARAMLVAAVAMLPAAALLVAQNKQVTGSWLTLPYQLSRYQYGVPATFTFQPNPVPHRRLTPEQQLDYDAQIVVHGNTDSVGAWFARLITRIRFYRFFFLAPLWLVIPAYLLTLREYRLAWVAIVLALLWTAGAFYPYFYPHYIAAATCLFLLVTVKSLAVFARWRPAGEYAVALILTLCLAHFVYWYGIEFAGTHVESDWITLNFGDPDGRLAISRQLKASPGNQLVFVHFSQAHGPQEWIHNAADIDRSRVVWAIDRGSEEDALLRKYYPDRTTWLLEADARPPTLRPWNGR